MKQYIREPSVPFTPDGYEKLLMEKKELVSKRPQAVEHLRKAREMGDLSENGYYKAARHELSMLDRRIRMVERLVKTAVIVKKQLSDSVQIGSTVELSEGGKTYSFLIVGGYESDPSKGKISHISPLGKGLMGKRKGDSVTIIAPKAVKTYTILSCS